jgi:hypothetical protein
MDLIFPLCDAHDMRREASLALHLLFTQGVTNMASVQKLSLSQVVGDMPALVSAFPTLRVLEIKRVGMSLAEVQLLGHGLSQMSCQLQPQLNTFSERCFGRSHLWSNPHQSYRINSSQSTIRLIDYGRISQLLCEKYAFKLLC